MTLEELKKALADGKITQADFDKQMVLVSGEDSTEMARGETVEIVEMKDTTPDAPIWIQIAKQGSFRGHNAGKFEMTLETFQQIITNFSSQQNRFIPVDFEHASEQHPTEGSIPHSGAPAQGWIIELAVRGDGNLYGRVEWGDLAKKYIKAKQYRYLSPAIVFGSKDRVTGKLVGARLSSVALTNNPFLDGMAPVAAKRTESQDKVIATAMTAVREALGLPAYFNEELLLVALPAFANDEAHVNKLRDALRLPLTMSTKDVFNEVRIACGAINPPPVVAVTEIEKPATAKGSDQMGTENKDKEIEVSTLTLSLSAANAQLVTLKNEHTVAMKTVIDENEALKVKLSQFEEREVAQLVDSAMAVWGEKKGLTADMRPHLMRIAKMDREVFASLYPPTVPGAPPPPSPKLVAATHHNVPLPNQQMQVEVPNNNVVSIQEAIKAVPKASDIAKTIMADAKIKGHEMTTEQAFSMAHKQRTELLQKAQTAGKVG